MNNSQETQCVNDKKIMDFCALSKQINTIGTLPAIIADLSVFGNMLNKERVAFYKVVQDLIPEEHRYGNTMIKKLLLYPEKHLNAYARNGEEDKWHTWVGVLEHALSESIKNTLEQLESEHSVLHSKLATVKERLDKVRPIYNNYLNSDFTNPQNN